MSHYVSVVYRNVIESIALASFAFSISYKEKRWRKQELCLYGIS